MGGLPWCVCGKRVKRFELIQERTFFKCARCGEDRAIYTGQCKTVYCNGIDVCRDCLTAQQVPDQHAPSA